MGPIGIAATTLGVNLASDLFGNILGRSNADYQQGLTKDLQQWQWDNFNSPKAQVRSLAGAGINPNALYGQQGSGQAVAPSGVGSPVSPVPISGVEPIGNFLKNLSDVDVNEAKIPEIEATAKNVLTDVKAKELEYELRQRYGNAKMSAELAIAQQSLRLAYQNGDLNEIEKSKKSWEVAKEKAIAGINEAQRGILEAQLGNIDKQIEQENKIREEKVNTEKSIQSSNYASASASRASAELSRSQVDINKELKEIRRIEREVAETGKLDQIDSLLSRYRADKMISDKEYEQARKLYESAKLFNDKGDKSHAVRLMYAMFDLLGEEIGNLSPIKPK